MEEFGYESRCVEGTFAPSGKATLPHGTCHRISCLADRAIIHIGEHEVECYFNGMSNNTKIPGFDGEVKCPTSNILCNKKIPCYNSCNGLGKCTDDGCVCDEGYYGLDCSMKCS
jgi:hypothetical protein